MSHMVLYAFIFLLGTPVFSMDLEPKSLEDRINYTFKDRQLFKCATTCPDDDLNLTSSNRGFERYEFLGDAVLDVLCKTYVQKNFPNRSSQFYNHIHSRFVRKEALLWIAEKWQLSKYVGRTDSSTQMSQGTHGNLGDYVEAIFGAIYLEAGQKKTYNLATELWKEYYKEVLKAQVEKMQFGNFIGIPSSFLGSSLVKLCCSEFLFRRFPHISEDALTSKMSLLTKKETLALAAQECLQLGPHTGHVPFYEHLVRVYASNGLVGCHKEVGWVLTSHLSKAISESIRRPSSVPRTLGGYFIQAVSNPDHKFCLEEELQIRNIPYKIILSSSFEKGSLSFEGSLNATNLGAFQVIGDSQDLCQKNLEKRGLQMLTSKFIACAVQKNDESDKNLLVDLGLMEKYLYAFASRSFVYHVVASKKIGKDGEAFRMEVQGVEVPCRIAEGSTLLKTQYYCIAKSLKCLLKKYALSVIAKGDYMLPLANQPILSFAHAFYLELVQAREPTFSVATFISFQREQKQMIHATVKNPKTSRILGEFNAQNRELAELGALIKAAHALKKS